MVSATFEKSTVLLYHSGVPQRPHRLLLHPLVCLGASEGPYFAKTSYGRQVIGINVCLPSIALCAGWPFEAPM